VTKKILMACLLWLMTFGSAQAASEFRTRVQITYEFNPDGTSRVTQEYSLTNLTSQTTASAYEFGIIDAAPQNLTAYDHHGQLNLKTVSTGTGLTRVLIPFNQLTAGKGKTYNFFLSYTGPSVSQIDGLWKISLPVATSDSNQQITVQLIVPEQFGQPMTLNPTTSSFLKKSGQLIYTFPFASAAQTSGIYAIFGNLQLIGFTLSYSSVRRGTNLEIPTDKPGQLVFIQKVEPTPYDIIATADGKWLARYRKSVPQAIISGYLLLDASSSASFPSLGHLSLTNLTSLPQALPSIPQVRWHQPIQLLPLIAFPSRITITNSGPQAIYHLAVTLTPQNLFSTSPLQTIIPVIPPYGQFTLPVRLFTPLLPGLTGHQLGISAGSTQVTYNIDANLFILGYVAFAFIIIVVFITLGFFTHYAWGLHFQKRRR
jgi:hypothetical protein